MPKSKPGRESRAWVGGYEQGSVYNKMTREQKRAFTAWLKERNKDNYEYERQLER